MQSNVWLIESASASRGMPTSSSSVTPDTRDFATSCSDPQPTVWSSTDSAPSSLFADDVARLGEIAAIAALLDAPRTRDEAVALASRLAEGRYYVACVGQFKRGKSTLIDALVDDPVLPAGVVPITAVPTVVRYGVRRAARVRLANTRGVANGTPEWNDIAPEDLAHYVSEEHNPENRKGVLGVEVFVPSSFLADGMCLVDTPGLGSVLEANTRATRAFIPQIDAAIVVIGADPPITGDELELVADVARHVSTLLFVLNKIDRVTDKDRRVAADFARRVVEQRLRKPVDHVYEVSATEALAHCAPTREWNALVSAVRSLVPASEGLVHDAGQRGIARLARQLLGISRETREAILQPVEESERHIRSLGEMMRDGQRALADLGPLFAAEQHRVSKQFASDRSQFLVDSRPAAQQLLANECQRIRSRFGPALRRSVNRSAREVARQILEPWLLAQQEKAGTTHRESMARFITLAKEFLDRVPRAGGVPSDDLPTDLDDRLQTQPRFVFNEALHVAEPASPLRFVADLMLGLVSPRTITRGAERFLDRLLEMNSSRVQSDVEERIAESRARLEKEIRALLNGVADRAIRALARASELRSAGTAAIESELHRLDEVEAALRRLTPSVDRPPQHLSASSESADPARWPLDT